MRSVTSSEARPGPGADLGFFIHVLAKRNGMPPSKVVARALERRSEIADGEDQVQLWALFDRDQHPDVVQAMRVARTGGVRVAFSHPSFDLWLLLHFADLSGAQSGSSRIVHAKLRRCPGFATFDVHNDKSVSGARAQALNGQLSVAVKRAKRLTDACPTGECSAADGHAEHYDPLRRDPSTDVWQLLLELGGQADIGAAG
jgi:hypothetical protein